MSVSPRVIAAAQLPLRGPGGNQRAAQTVFVVLVALLPPFFLGFLLLPPLVSLAVGIPTLLLIPWVWNRPIRGLYILFGSAMLIEVFPLGFPDSLTDKIPLFLNLSNTNHAGVTGVPVAPAEILMLAVVQIWLAKGVATRSLHLPSGPLLAAYAVFLAVVLSAEVHGLLGHGDFNLSLWELRPQAYGFAAFMLTASLVENRRDLKRLGAVFLVVIFIKALIANYRYFVTLHQSLGSNETIMAHEESYFFAVFLFVVMAAVLWYGRHRLVGLLLVLSPAVAYMLIQNNRRAGMLAFVVGAAAVVLIGIRFDQRHRGALLVLTLFATAAFGVFLALYWNHNGGLAAEIVRPFRSLFQPDARDFQSDLYRQAENLNILATFKLSPLFGFGFGRKMVVIYPMADISYIYPLWNVIPHNTYLWIGMRMGAVGFMSFWGLIGMAILSAMRTVGVSKDPLLKVFGTVAVAAILAEIVVGYTDLQLEGFRNLIFLGALLGAINRTDAWREKPETEASVLGREKSPRFVNHPPNGERRRLPRVEEPQFQTGARPSAR